MSVAFMRDRALADELVPLDVLERVREAALESGPRDVVAYVLVHDNETTIRIFDRREISTSPDLPEALRFIRNAGSGTWVVAIRDRDNAAVRFRVRFLRMVQGGVA